MRSSFIRLFPHSRCYSLHFYYFYIQEILPGTIALAIAFRFAFPCRHLVHCFVVITGFFHRFTITLFIANFALVFPA